MAKQLNITEQEELFSTECKLINLKYEYQGYTGTEKWAVVSELSEKELSMEMTIMPITFGKTYRSRKLTEYPTWLPHTEVVINLFMDRKVKMDSVRKLLDKLKNTGKSC